MEIKSQNTCTTGNITIKNFKRKRLENEKTSHKSWEGFEWPVFSNWKFGANFQIPVFSRPSRETRLKILYLERQLLIDA